jgi:acyl carrier protein
MNRNPYAIVSDMSEQEFIQAFEEILEMTPGTLTGSAKLEDLENWDSVAMVTLMSVVDEKCGVQLSPRKFASCQTVKDLYQLTQAA